MIIGRLLERFVSTGPVCIAEFHGMSEAVNASSDGAAMTRVSDTGHQFSVR